MTSSRPAAGAAIVLGLAAIASMPAGAVAAQLSAGVGLLQSLYITVPAAALLGLLAALAGRRARLALERSVFRDASTLVRAGRLLAWAGLYVAAIGGIALGVYAYLHYSR